MDTRKSATEFHAQRASMMSMRIWIVLGSFIASLTIVIVCWWALRKEPLYDLRVQFSGQTRSWIIRDEDDFLHAQTQIIAGILTHQDSLTESGDQPVIYGYFEFQWDAGIRPPAGMNINSRVTSESVHYVIRRNGTRFTSGSIRDGKWMDLATSERLEFVISEATSQIHYNLSHSRNSLKGVID